MQTIHVEIDHRPPDRSGQAPPAEQAVEGS
jgi:hypothetical protein